MMRDKPSDSSGTRLVIKELVTYRNLVRRELGFGESVHTDSNMVWIGSVPFEK